MQKGSSWSRYGALGGGRGRDRRSSLDDAEAKQADRQNATATSCFLISHGIGIAVFFITLLVINLLYTRSPNVVIFLAFMALATCACLLLFRSKRNYLWPIAISALIALAAGTVAGLLIYDLWGHLSNFYRTGKTYENLVPSVNPAEVEDAGRILFSVEAYVDQEKAVGYSADDGTKYCIAPIRDASQSSSVGFWAVGYECCSWTGSFNCDAAGDSAARGGIVVQEGTGIFQNSNKHYYNLARQKAEALGSLTSNGEPLYVRWVADNNLDMLENRYTVRMWLACFACTLAYALLLSGFIFSVCKAHCESKDEDVMA